MKHNWKLLSMHHTKPPRRPKLVADMAALLQDEPEGVSINEICSQLCIQRSHGSTREALRELCSSGAAIRVGQRDLLYYAPQYSEAAAAEQRRRDALRWAPPPKAKKAVPTYMGKPTSVATHRGAGDTLAGHRVEYRTINGRQVKVTIGPSPQQTMAADPVFSYLTPGHYDPEHVGHLGRVMQARADRWRA